MSRWHVDPVASWRREPERLSETWVAYRQSDHRYPAMWRAGSRTNPKVQPAARWHREGEYIQYTSLTEAAAWAELVRHEEIHEQQTREDNPRVLWRIWVTEHDVADLSTSAHFRACGLPIAMMDRRGPDGRWDYGPCQSLAAELRAAGYRALLAPSAALAGATCLSLFDERFELEPGLHTLGERRTENRDPERFVLATCIADRALVPLGVLKECGIPAWDGSG